jgi:hypothetical protein
MGVAVYFVSAVAYRTIKRPEVPHSPPTGTSIEPCPTCRGHGKVEYTSFGRLVWEARGPWWWPPARVWGWWPDESAPECRMYKPVEDSV